MVDSVYKIDGRLPVTMRGAVDTRRRASTGRCGLQRFALVRARWLLPRDRRWPRGRLRMRARVARPRNSSRIIPFSGRAAWFDRPRNAASFQSAAHLNAVPQCSRGESACRMCELASELSTHIRSARRLVAREVAVGDVSQHVAEPTAMAPPRAHRLLGGTLSMRRLRPWPEFEASA